MRWLPAIQLALLLCVTALFTLFDWDRRVAAQFYREGQGWYLGGEPLWDWLYEFGTIPGILLALAALIAWLAGFYVQRLASLRRGCLVVLLTTVIAAGLLVNVILKPYWGRPRPAQTTEFAGQWEYQSVFPPGISGKGKSFPCGHCTMGFVFLSLVAFRRRSKVLAYGGVAVGIGLGFLLSAARVVQGAHFLSDTIWSLGIVGMVATALIVYLPHGRAAAPDTDVGRMSPWRKTWITIGTLLALAVIVGGFMTRRPFYKSMDFPLKLTPATEILRININMDPESVSVHYADQAFGRLKVAAHGFGWMEHDYQMGFGSRNGEKALDVTLHIETRSYFAELDHALTVVLPTGLKDRVAVLVNSPQGTE